MKSSRWVSVMALIVLTLGACGGRSDQPAGGAVTTVDVTVSAPTEPNITPWLVGQKKGFFEKHGVEIGNIVAGQGGATTLRALVSGDLAIADVSTPAVIKASLAGTPVTVVGGSTRSAYGTDFYALADNARVNSIADARKWAFSSAGSVTEAFTYMLPAAAGIDPATLERVGAGGLGEGIALLEAGTVDVASVTPSVIAKDSAKFKLIASAATYLPDFQATVLAAQTDYAKKNPAVVAGIVAGLDEAQRWIGQNPEEAGDIYAEEIGLTPEQGRATIRNALAGRYWSVGIEAQALRTAVEAMRPSGFDQEVPWCALFDLDDLPAGLPRDLPTKCG